jgi:ketosteroid isomerase-like protein
MRVRVLGCAVAILFVAGCEKRPASSPSPAEPGAAPVAKVATAPTPPAHALQSALVAFNRVSLEDAAAPFADDLVWQFAQKDKEPVRGRAELLSLWKAAHVAMPDLKVEPKRIIDAKRFWVLEGVLTGTQYGRILDRAGTQKKLGTQLALFAWVGEGGKIHQSLLCGNPLAVVKQIDSASDAYQGPPVPQQAEVVAADSNPAFVAATRQFFKAFQEGDLGTLSDLMAPNVVIHAYGDGVEIRGLDALRKGLVEERQAFEGTSEVEEAASAGPYVAAIVRVKGTFKANLGGHDVAGKSFSERGIDVFRFEGGRIVEWDNYRNQMDFQTQLGIYPPQKKDEGGEARK